MTRELCKSVCRECPFKRTSAPGYLGESSGDPWDFLSSFSFGNGPLPCHLQVNWEREDAQEKAQTARLCRGAMTMLRNEMKMPDDPDLKEAYMSVEPDKETVFSSRSEFIQYHHNPRLASVFRDMLR